MFGIFKRRPRKVADLEARLSSAEPGLFGEIEYEALDDGSWEFEIELKHRDVPLAHGGTLDVRVDGRVVGRFTPGAQATFFRRTHHDGDLGFLPAPGQTVDLVQDGVVRLSGAFAHD